MAESTVLSSLEAEMAVIGGILTAPIAFSDVAAIVSENDFSTDLHRRIFSEMATMAESGTPIDILTLAESLESRKALQEGDWAYIATTQLNTPSAANVLAYARIVRDRSRRKQLLRLAADLQNWALRDNAETALANLKVAMDAVAVSAGMESGLVPIKSLLSGVTEEIDKRNSGFSPRGVQTGLPDFDALIGGLKPGLLYLIAGRPAMGKSVLGLQIAERVVANGGKAAYYTAEMPNAEQVERLVAAVGRISLGKLQDGDLSDDDWSRLTSAVWRLSEARLWLDETGAPRLDDLLTKTRRLKRQQQSIGLIVIDHAGLVEAGGENRQQSQSAVARALKGLAKEMNCPVIALVQLSRRLEDRTDKRPILADLRDSGEWEQSADVVAMLYRDEVYDQDSQDKGCAELLIRKHRGGKLGVVPLSFHGEFCRFESLAGGLPSWAIAPSRRNERGIYL